jgi:ECF transporter S component (folate family)
LNKKSFTTQLVVMALLIALEIILTRFLSIETPTMRIGFGFLPVAIMAILYGPWWTGAAGIVGDLVGMTLLPKAAFFPGFTLTAFLTGVIFGLVLYKKPITWKRTLVAALAVNIICSLCLDTIWLSMMYGDSFLVLLPVRLIKVIIMIPVETILIYTVWTRAISKVIKID